MELTAEKIAELKLKHGNDLISVTAPSGVVLVFKKPSKEIWAYYQDGLSREKVTRTQCFLRLALDCVVLPSQQDASVIFTDYPALPTSVAKDLAELAGLSDDLDVKKL